MKFMAHFEVTRNERRRRRLAGPDETHDAHGSV
jgi:hypothetical protein